MLRFKTIITSALVLSCLLLASPAHADFVIKDVEVNGLEKIAKGTFFTYLPVKVGETFDESKSPEVLRALYQTGFFKHIALAEEDGVLQITVVERPAIADLTFSGNSKIDDDNLKQALEQVGLVKGRLYNKTTLERMQLELQRMYFSQGRYGVEVDAQVEELERNRVKVTLTIDEGKPAKIKDIDIIGVNAFAEDKLLEQLEQGTKGWNVFSSRDQYSKVKFTGDLEKLTAYYQDRGYMKFHVDSTQVSITPDKRDIYLTIHITEGDQYTVSSVAVAGKLVVEEEVLMNLILLKSGDIFSRKLSTLSSERITRRLGDEGFAFANVNVIPEIDEEHKTVALTFFIDPASRVHVRNIDFAGNYVTREEVLRREMRQMEGAWYATSKVERSKVRMQRLSFIESVDVQTVPVAGTADQVDLHYDVKERLSGSFQIGAGYSQGQGFLFNSSLSQDNFMGTGERVSLSAETSAFRDRYSLSFTNPYYTLDGVSRGYSIYYRKTDANAALVASYLTDAVGGALTYGIPLNEYNTFRISFGYENTNIVKNETDSTTIAEFLATSGSSFDIYTISPSFIHDTRNRVIFATSGSMQRFDVEVAVPLSDSLEYLKMEYRNQFYFPVGDQSTVLFHSDLARGIGYGDTDALPFFERYFAGGVYSVRGYQNNSLGTAATREDSGSLLPLGGAIKVVGGLDFQFPVPFTEDSNSVRLSTFVDMGNVFLNSDDLDLNELRGSYGVGLVWLSPIGPLAFSLARPFNDGPDDQTQTFQFQIGTGF